MPSAASLQLQFEVESEDKIRISSVIEHRAIAEHKPIPESRLSIMSFKFEELVGPTLLIGKGKEVFTKVLLKGKKFVM